MAAFGRLHSQRTRLWRVTAGFYLPLENLKEVFKTAYYIILMNPKNRIAAPRESVRFLGQFKTFISWGERNE